jgi:NitT/TauT family transport system substrate-binding protein
LLAGCGPPEHSPASVASPLRIGIDLWAGYYPLILADELGYLEQHGVRIDISIPKNTDRMLAEFAANQLDAVAVSFADVVTLTRVAPDLRLVLVSDESCGGDMILSRTAARSAEELRGKRIGTNLGGFGELFVRRFLRHHGLAPTDAAIVGCDAADAAVMLAKGELDLAHTWDPYASQAIAQGAVKVFSSADTPGLILDGLVVRGSVLRDRRDELRRLTVAWFQAVDWWRAHREEGARRIEARLGLTAGEALPKGLRLLEAPENRRLMQGGDKAPLCAVADSYIDFFVARGLLTRRPRGGSLFDGSLLP